MLHPTLKKHCAELLRAINPGTITRPTTLQQLVNYLVGRLKAGQTAHVLVVCTHNARRSQIAQYWLAVGAAYFGLPDIIAYSGGTEVTAVHPHTAAAMQRMGLSVVSTDPHTNRPAYQVRWNDTMPAVLAYSKLYQEALSMDQDFVALLVCDTAACPYIAEAEAQIALPYEDPGTWDYTLEQAYHYDQAVQAIGTELLWALKKTAEQL